MRRFDIDVLSGLSLAYGHAALRSRQDTQGFNARHRLEIYKIIRADSLLCRVLDTTSSGAC